jgi:hypothetical protein
LQNCTRALKFRAEWNSLTVKTRRFSIQMKFLRGTRVVIHHVGELAGRGDDDLKRGPGGENRGGRGRCENSGGLVDCVHEDRGAVAKGYPVSNKAHCLSLRCDFQGRPRTLSLAPAEG